MDALEKSTHDWIKLDEVFYRRFRMTMFPEPLKKISFPSCHIAVAKNGGLMAFIKKHKHLIMDNNSPIKDNLLVYYQNGVKEVEAIRIDITENILLFEFTHEEDLICLLADGRLYKFDIFCLSYEFDFIGLTFAENNIIDARLHDKGIIMLTENGDFYINSNYKEPGSMLYFSSRKYISDFSYYNFISNCSTLNLKGSINPNSTSFKNNEVFYPCDFAIISSLNSSSGKNELLIPHSKHGIIIYIENDNMIRYMKKNYQTAYSIKSGTDSFDKDDLGQVLKIAPSINGTYIAFYNTNKYITVFPTTLEPNDGHLSKVDLTLTSPFQLMWCSNDCLISLCAETVGLIGPEDKTMSFQVKPNSYLVQEIDGIRIIQDDKVEFLQRVSEELYDTTFPLSSNCSKKLVDAYKLIEENKPNCDAEIRAIKSDLPDAVSKVLKASTNQWDTFHQLYLIKAAQHGKNFLTKDEFSFNYFVITCKDLRILNNLRTSDKPRLITYDQYKHLEIKNLVNHLLKMQNFHLAFEIYQYLGFNVKDIYEKWAVAYIKNIPTVTTTDEEKQHFSHIQEKIKETNGISLIKLAKESFKGKKDDLGMLFLEQEKCVIAKIPQYVELGRWDKAIELTLETYDSNMMNAVLDKMIKILNLNDFISTASLYVKAFPNIIEFLKSVHPEILETFLKTNSLQEELLLYYIEQYFNSAILKERTFFISQGKLIVNEFLKKSNTNEDWKFYSQYLNDLESSLILKSDLLSEGFIKSDITTIDKPLYSFYIETIANEKYTFIEMKNKQLFDISLRKINILRIKAYADNKLSDAIKILNQGVNISNSNFIAYAEICFDNKLFDEAVIFLRKVNSEDVFEYKITLLIEMAKYNEALESVISNKDYERKGFFINMILNKDASLNGKVKELCVRYKVNL